MTIIVWSKLHHRNAGPLPQWRGIVRPFGFIYHITLKDGSYYITSMVATRGVWPSLLEAKHSCEQDFAGWLERRQKVMTP